MAETVNLLASRSNYREVVLGIATDTRESTSTHLYSRTQRSTKIVQKYDEEESKLQQKVQTSNTALPT